MMCTHTKTNSWEEEEASDFQFVLAKKERKLTGLLIEAFNQIRN